MPKPNLSTALQEATGSRPTVATAPPSRVGTVPVTFHLPRGVRDQLKILAAEQRMTMVALVSEGLNAVFAHYGRPEIAPAAPRGAAKMAGERHRGGPGEG